jgi:3D (Asp-Asp-Asp) domain-containing protein
VAVDPRVIPLGSLVYVEGYGMGLACDTGSAIKGNRIDLLMASSSQANAWGRRKVVVHVLKRR